MALNLEAKMSRVLIPLAQGFEELEAITVVDLLRRAGIEVITVGLEPGPVRASRGVVLAPDTTLDRSLGERFDMVVLPGGREGAERLGADSRIRELLVSMNQSGGYLAAICAAPRVLAEAGVLVGRRATAFPGTLDDLPEGSVVATSEAVVTDGPIVTSRGPGTALDFALELIRILAGTPVREQVEAQLQRP